MICLLEKNTTVAFREMNSTVEVEAEMCYVVMDGDRFD